MVEITGTEEFPNGRQLIATALRDLERDHNPEPLLRLRNATRELVIRGLNGEVFPVQNVRVDGSDQVLEIQVPGQHQPIHFGFQDATSFLALHPRRQI